MSKEEIKRLIEESFRKEVAYIQGTINNDSATCQRRRWMSLHTVVGTLEVHFELHGLHDGIGFSSAALRKED